MCYLFKEHISNVLLLFPILLTSLGSYVSERNIKLFFSCKGPYLVGTNIIKCLWLRAF